MRGDMPDIPRCLEEVERGTRRVTDRRTDPSGLVRVHGEMVDVLAREGNECAASRLEELWSEARTRCEITQLCSYDLGAFALTCDCGSDATLERFVTERGAKLG